MLAGVSVIGSRKIPRRKAAPPPAPGPELQRSRRVLPPTACVASGGGGGGGGGERGSTRVRSRVEDTTICANVSTTCPSIGQHDDSDSGVSRHFLSFDFVLNFYVIIYIYTPLRTHARMQALPDRDT